MRNITWLFRWNAGTRHSLSLAIVLGMFGFSARAQESETQPKSGSDTPAPVLKVARQQPELNVPTPDDKSRPKSSSRRTLVAEPTNSAAMSEAQATSPQTDAAGDELKPVPLTIAAKPDAPVTSPSAVKVQQRPSAQVVANDGWVARGTSAQSRGLTKESSPDAPRVSRNDLPKTAPAKNADAPATTRPADPPSLDPVVEQPRSQRSSNGTAATPNSSNHRQPAPLLDPPAASELQPVPKMVPPGTQDNRRMPAAAETTESPSLAAPRNESTSKSVTAPLQDAPLEVGVGTDVNALAAPIGSGLPVNREDMTIRRPTIETEPARRREIAAERRADPERSRKLQEQIERFEQESNAPRDVVADDLYDNPSVDANHDSNSSAAKVDPRQQRALEEDAKRAPVIPAAALRLKDPISQCLQYYHNRPENARERTPWGMLHAILPYGVDANIDAGRRRYNAIAWLAGNNPCRDLRMMSTTRDGQIVARSGVGLQGHQAQTLAIFAQAGVPAEYPLQVNGRRFSVTDLVRSEMAACKSGEELTFTLIGLSNYLPTDTRWRTADGEVWDFERLIREELSQPVVGAACGGTHRLMGLSFALRQRRLEGLPLEGQWLRAETYINDFIDYAWSLQNRDGSFSTDWFEGRADNGDRDRKIQTSGHIMEWLIFISTPEQLCEERVTRGVTFLANELITNRRNEWEVGPKGHALRALSLYHRRMFASDRPWLPNQQVARSK